MRSRSSFPALGAGAALLLLVLVGLLGLSRVEFSDDYREIFRTNDTGFALLEEIAQQFGNDESEVVVVLRGEDILTREAIGVLEELTDGIASTPGVAAVHSPTTVSRLPSLAANTTDPETRTAARQAVAAHPMLGGHLISRDLDAALIVIRLQEDLRQLDEAQPTLEALDRRLAAVEATNLALSRAGFPYLRLETVRSVQHDQMVFTAVGVVLAAFITFAIFRDGRLALLVAAGPAAAAVWTVGAMGWLSEPLNVINNVVPVLVLVIGMTDSVHFVREYQRLRRDHPASDQRSTALAAMRKVAVPCALTSFTTMLGFSSLVWADVGIVRRFGLACAGGLALSLLAVLTTGPLLAGWTSLGRSRPKAPWSMPARLQAFLQITRNHALAISAASCVLLVFAVASAVWLKPDFRYREFLPASSATLHGLNEVESAFGGSYAVRVVVDWPQDAAGAEILELIAAVEQVLEESSIGGKPLSVLASLRSMGGTQTPVADLPSPGHLPISMRERLWRPEDRRTLVEVRVPGRGAAAFEPQLAALEASIARLERENPGFALRVSGLYPVSARTSLRMIRSLGASLAVAALLILMTLAVATRSARLGVVCVIPNLLPLGMVCLFLLASGRPLQFTTVTVLAVVLGLAVDDTIHMLVRVRRAQRAGADIEAAVATSLESVGSSLVITTALLVAGFGAVGLSRAPLMSLFGWLVAGALLVALVADLLILPALLRVAFAPDGRFATSKTRS